MSGGAAVGAEGYSYDCGAFRLDVSGCLEDAIGEHGLSTADFDLWSGRLADELSRLREEIAGGDLPIAEITKARGDLSAAAEAYGELCVGARTVLFFGTGGSGLGGQTLAQLAGWNIAGSMMPGQMQRPRTRFYDNLDPATMQGVLNSLDLASSRFVFTSKSGGTAETLAQAIALLSAVKSAGLEQQIPKMFLGITEEAEGGQENGLRRLFGQHGVPMLAHPKDIGGRFSCMTVVGLLPALARGLDPLEIRAGGRAVLEQVVAAKSVTECSPALSAITSVAMAKERGVRALVLMPYADRLGYLARWFVQLWAESLGKGGEGTTPIAALGPLDQHSQLQLFMDGPREHLISLIRVPTAGTGPLIDPELAETAGAGYMGGKTIGDVVHAQADALPEALAKAGRAVRTIDIHRLDANAIGAVMMHFMLETILTGRALGVDPFDQPAVELAKVLTRERLVGSPAS
ncbi:MAG: glucose-6-phosphate isomerase [Filomicrobium sp.]